VISKCHLEAGCGLVSRQPLLDGAWRRKGPSIRRLVPLDQAARVPSISAGVAAGAAAEALQPLRRGWGDACGRPSRRSLRTGPGVPGPKVAAEGPAMHLPRGPNSAQGLGVVPQPRNACRSGPADRREGQLGPRSTIPATARSNQGRAGKSGVDSSRQSDSLITSGACFPSARHSSSCCRPKPHRFVGTGEQGRDPAQVQERRA